MTPNYWLSQIEMHDPCHDGLDLARSMGLEALARICTAPTWADAVAAAEPVGATQYLGWLLGRVLPVRILEGQDLTGADLSWADLNGADLNGAIGVKR